MNTYVEWVRVFPAKRSDLYNRDFKEAEESLRERSRNQKDEISIDWYVSEWMDSGISYATFELTLK